MIKHISIFTLLVMMQATLQAQTTYTSVTTGNWSNTATWSPAGVPGATDHVTIASGHTVTLTETVDITTGNLTVTGTLALAGYDLTAGSLAGAGNIGSASGTPLLTVGSNGSNTTYSGAYSGTGARLTKAGSGTLTLSGANSYSGATTIAAGSLQLGTASDRISNSTPLTVDSGATFDMNGFSETIGSLAGAGTVTSSATGALSLRAGGDNTSTTFSGVIQNGSATSITLTKQGSGTLTLSGVNTYTGTTAISSGTLQLGASGVIPDASAVQVFGTLDLSGFSESVASIAENGTITSSVAGSVTLTHAGSGTTVFSGVIQNGSGTVALTKSGSGTLTLSGANTYTGTTTVSAGTLSIGSGSTTGEISSSSNVTNNATLTFNRSNAYTYSGSISGTGAVTKSGAGTLTLGGTNTYSGTTTISAGTLQLGASGVIPDASALTVTGTLDLSGFSETVGSLAGAGTVTSGVAGSVTLTHGGNGNTTFSGVIQNGSGTVALTKEGSGTLTLSGANLYTGTTTVSAGTLSIGSGSTTGEISSSSNVTNNAALTFNRSNAFTYSGSISGTGAVTKSGAGTLTLGGTNTYSGTTTISAGTLRLGADSTLPATTTVALSAASSSLDLNGFNQTIAGFGSSNASSTVTNSGAGACTLTVNNASSSTFAGIIQNGTGGVALTKEGSGTLTLSGANTYTGTTTISAGTLSIGAGSTTGSIVSDVTNNATLTFNRSNAYTYSGIISGTGAVTKLAAGTLTLSGASTYTGITTISGGTLSISADNNLGAAPGSPTAGHLVFTASSTLNTTASFTLNANRGITLATSTINTDAGTTLTYGGVMTGTSSTLAKQGTGQLTLTGTNTYTGATTISAGTLSLGNGGTSGSVAGNITNNSALIIDRSDNLTYSGVISGSGSVTKQGSGTLTISGANSYTGATTISAGILQLGSANERISNSSALTIASGAIFDMNGRTETIASLAGAGTVTSSSAGSITLTLAATTGSTTFSGAILDGSGTIALTKSGASTQTLSGVSTYTGNTTIPAGTLVINNASALGSSALVTVSSTGTLQTDVSLALNRLTISATTAKVNLNGNNSTTTRLTLGTAVQQNGTHGSTASAATFKNDSYFTSTSAGVLTNNDCAFTVEVVTTANGQAAGLPLLGNANVTVYWGDGLNDTYTSSGTRSHTYALAGTYTVTVFGSFTQLGTGTFYSNADKLTRVLDWGCTGINSLPAAFIGATNLIDVPNTLPAGVTNLSSTFRGATSFNDPDVANWNTAAVTTMASCFDGASIFNQNIGSWNTSAVTSMADMFTSATAFNQNIGNWNTSQVTTMMEMFFNATSFNNGGNNSIDNWNTANVTSMTRMFASASAFNQPIGSWNTGSVTSMTQMFDNADSFNQPIGAWNTTNVIAMNQMFLGNDAFNQPIGTWNTANVTNTSYMFINATAFNNGGSDNINNWITGSVTNMQGMFQGASVFNQPIGSWNTGSVTNMGDMFSSAITFNQPIGSWNTANVTNMSNMFNNADAFNQNIGAWNTGNVTTMEGMFRNNDAFNNGGSPDINNWNTSSVTNMTYMFQLATAFNQPVGGWNTAAVTGMTGMFNGATAFNNGGSDNINNWNTAAVTNMFALFQNAVNFNQPIGNWNTGNVTTMEYMFNGADAFNQNISSWNTANVTTMADMFNSAEAFDQNIGGWNIDKVTSMTNMFSGLCLSPANYDSILIGWAAQPLRESNVPFHGGYSYHTSAGTASRTALTGTGWTITDGGLDTDVSLTSAAGTNSQTVELNDTMTSITYNFPGTADAVFTGLPAGVTGSVSGGVATISGIPSALGVYNYTVDGCGGLTGTITVTCSGGTASSTPTLCINTALTSIIHRTAGATGIGTPTGLPAGVTANWASDTITISGTPTEAGTFSYSIPLTGGCGSVNATGTITVIDWCFIYNGGSGRGDIAGVSSATTMSNFWVGTVSTSWSDAANWSQNSVLATGENLFFASNAVRDLITESPRTVGDIVFLPEGKTINVGDVDLTVTGTIENADATRYLKTNGTGSVKRSVGTDSTVTFPVGNSTYNPVTITNNTGMADDFSVRVQDAVLMEATTDTSVNYPMVNRTWHIDKTIPSANAGGGVNFVFQWDTTQQVNDITTFALNHYNGTDWHFAADSGGTQSVSGVNPKQLTFTGYRGTFSPFAIGYDYGPLPVSWKEVRTECTTDNKVTVHWSTATEINNDYFTVERSADGRNWEAVGKMPGNGTTSQEQTYVFTDVQKPSTAAAYYRIKQTDYNGAFAYSSVVVANCRAEQAVRLYPNPAQQWAVLDGVTEGTEWTMYSASGQPVAKGRCESSRCILNTADIPAGSYVLQAGSRRMPLVVMP